ncbi:MAG: choice-of-anchor D domain-containing protein [Candidatus Acidiferrum sp.]
MLGNGDGTFRLGASYDVAVPELDSITAADLRNNGKTDLIVGEFEGMGVAVLLGNGDGTFQQPVLYEVSSPLGVATADFNGDGILDIVASSVGKATLYSTGVFPWGVATADFNGDHLPDVAVVDLETHQAFTLLNTGVVSFSPTTEIAFKKQKHGTTSPPQTVTLTNTGKSSLKISSMNATGQFGMTTTCKASVAPGASCTIKVTFSPQTQGAKSGTVSIDDSASKKPQVIALSGDGT